MEVYFLNIKIWAVNSVDGMTANWARIPFDTLDLISSEIINNVKGINKVVFDISNKPPSTIEWEWYYSLTIIYIFKRIVRFKIKGVICYG